MKYQKLVIRFTSPFTSLPSANQLFGQLVWAVSGLYGEAKASSLVEQWKENPPFFLSEAVPEGYLPVPVLPIRERATQDSATRAKAKQNKKRAWIALSDFRVLQRDTSKFTEIVFQKGPSLQEISETHVQIDRLTGRASDGQLYTARYLSTPTPVIAYVRWNTESEALASLLQDVCAYWSQVGLGGDRNVGRGSCSVSLEALSETEMSLLSYKDTEDGPFMTLSRCSGEDLLDHAIAYRMDAYSGITGPRNDGLFNKKPVIGFLAGSTFTSGKGCIVTDIHPDKNVCMYAYAFPLHVEV